MIGRTISHYTILEKLGEGGMGVVYKARDTHLNRFVAIKVLPAEKVADPERKQRFVQEAKAASSLNHPNIITIYDIGQAESVDFISMECVSGKTLDRLIPRHGMRLSEALKYAIQIADALARAHSAGIVHRDLKPGNIMVNEHGLVKVLDFGLAKLTEATSTGEDESTRTMRPWTEEGKIVGTVAYMSPEQAEGIKVDARADIFSFGSVLYEMVTGGQAFRRDTKAATLAAILKDNPRPASQLVDGLPGEMERLISRCLRKEVNRRFQHMDDLKVALLDLKEESDSGKLSGMTGSTLPTGGRKSWLAWAGGLVILFLMVAAGLWRLFLRREVNLGLAPKTVPLTSYVGEECCASFSPDGNQVAFVWDGPQQNNVDIYVKLIGTENMLRLTTDPTGDFSPAWSPDGRYIAFLRFLAENKAGVFLVPAIGGPQRKLAEISDWRNGGLTWYPDGKWLAVPDQNSISLLSVDTGEKRKLTLPPAENSDNTPAFSPDGQHLAFSRNVAFTSEIYLLALSRDLAPKGEPKQLTFTHQRFTWPVWTANGREIISSFGKGLGWKEDELLRLPIDDGGPPQPLSPPVQGQGPAISRRGDRLAYMRRLEDLNIWRVEMPGPNRKASEPVNLISSTYNDGFPQYSPDGKRVVFVSDRSGHSEIWACASDGSNAQQLTSLGAAGSPRWSPEGQRIVFDSNVEGQFDLYMIDADGGAPKRMTNDPADDAVASWSRDGRWIYFVSNRTKEFQVWKMPADGGEALQVTKHGGYVAFESLDGKFVYFSKDLPQTNIWRIPAGGGDEANILKSTAGFAVAGGGIYFITPHSDGSSALQFHNFATGKVTTVAAIHRQIPGGLSVSPDERYVLYTQIDQSGTDLMLVEHFR